MSTILWTRGRNDITLRVLKRNERLAGEINFTLDDVELEVCCEYPNGDWLPDGE